MIENLIGLKMRIFLKLNWKRASNEKRIKEDRTRIDFFIIYVFKIRFSKNRLHFGWLQGFGEIFITHRAFLLVNMLSIEIDI